MKIKNIKTGFTLLETLIVLFIFSSLMILVVYFGINISSFNNFLAINMSSQAQIQLTLSSLVSELRSMGPSNLGSYPIEYASQNTLTFFSDIDQDGLFERVRYFLDGTIIKKGVIKPSGSPLIYDLNDENVSDVVDYVTNNLIFSYYPKKFSATDPAMTAPINPNLIRSIKAEITADQTPNIEPGPVSFSTFATIRNFRMSQ